MNLFNQELISKSTSPLKKKDTKQNEILKKTSSIPKKIRLNQFLTEYTNIKIKPTSTLFT
jgi:hypothetical protein